MPVCSPRIDPEFRVMLIGEAPGENEDIEGRPFVGKAGKILRDNIPSGWEKQLYWSNAVRCRPPKNRTPIPQEVECCSVYQEEDLVKIKPHAILALGDVALKYFWNTAWVTGMRGIPFPVQLGDGTTTWVMSTFHPSYVMRQNREDYNTGKTTNSMLPVFRKDIHDFFGKLPYYADNPPKIYTPPKQIFYPKSREEALYFFHKLKEPYCVDIETAKLKPYMRDSRIITAGFSDGDITFAFPVSWPGGISDWGLDAFNTIMRIKKQWIASHASFEYIWIWTSTETHDHNFHDIEAMARLIHKRKGIGSLDDLTRIYLGVDIKKLTDMDKGRLMDYPVEKVLWYNALDAWAEYEIFNILAERMTNIDVANYCRIIEAIKSTVGMEMHGLTVDIKESEKLQKDLFGKMRVFEQVAKTIPEIDEYEKKEKMIFHLSGPEQVGHVLVNYCGIQLPKTEKGQQYSTNSDRDLEPLRGKHPLVDLTLSFREVQKLLSTYVEPILSGKLIRKDGLLHPSYTVVHVATYRLSSEDPNIQNWPKRAHREIRRQVIAPEGYILAAFDYGQLEGRVIAMFTGDPALKKAFIEDDDIHWRWLYRIIKLYPQYMDRLAKISGETTEKEILKAGRTIIKTDFVFAAFYGSQPRSIAIRCELPFPIAEQVLNEFWSEYNFVKKWVDGQFIKYYDEGEVSSITGRIRNEVMPGNEVINSPVQGTAAEIVIEAQNALFRMGLQDFYYMPRINIHDDLVFILKDDSSAGDYIEAISTEIVKPRFQFVNVPLMTECRVGYNWCDLSAIKKFSGEVYHD